MYIAVWNKYLPVIRILLKRAVAAEQTLDLDRADFERAGSGRKAGYKFTIEFNNGKVGNVISTMPLASDLALVMMEDAATQQVLQNNDYHVSLNTKFKLSMKHVPKEVAALAEEDAALESETA